MQGITTHALLQPTGINLEHGVIESISLLDIRGVEIGRYSLSGLFMKEFTRLASAVPSPQNGSIT